MSERLDAAQEFVDAALKVPDQYAVQLIGLAVDRLISEIRELRIEVGK